MPRLTAVEGAYSHFLSYFQGLAQNLMSKISVYSLSVRTLVFMKSLHGAVGETLISFENKEIFKVFSRAQFSVETCNKNARRPKSEKCT